MAASSTTLSACGGCRTSGARRRFSADALTPEYLTRLAARLARFFDDAAPAPTAGAVEVIRDNVTENFVQVEPFVSRFVSRDTFAAVRRWQLGVLEREPGRFRARVEEGRIRDGHGDLRLEHVYFEDADPIVIDCVEFNERLRCGDAAGDVAFLAMELTARARVDLAELFLAAFALESDDHDLYGVVDFYAGYRAWVRGKVAAFLAADSSTPPEKAVRKAEEARTLFTLARAYAEARPGAQPVVAVGGVIGSGKSTLAEALGRATGAPSSRQTGSARRWPASAPPSGPRTAPTARNSQRARSTRCSGEPGSCWGPGGASCWTRRSASETSGSAPGTWPAPRPAVPLRRDGVRRGHARQRLRRRAAGPSVSDAGEALLERVRAEFEPVTELGAGEHVRVDTTGPPEAAVRTVLTA